MRPSAMGARLRTDQRGITMVEFGLLSPVMCLLLLGAFDVGHTLYMQSVLEGAVQKASRDTGLESGTVAGTRTVIDDKVRSQITSLVADPDITISRRFFRTFSQVNDPEDWTDTNTNGRCDNAESYSDANNNNTWDADGGDAGQGGAKDAVRYTVTVSYPRLFPLDSFIGLSQDVTLSAETIMANQPYAEQSTYAAPTVRTCPV